jgi:asparagine synthase (glutamine-hydrolysing)
MCGIVGMVVSGPGHVSRTILDKMTAAIVHRGPDDGGTYISPAGTAALGSRRLSIIDLSAAGHMPMTNEDRSIWLTFNGEIYNFATLRRELSSRGHQFTSQTDTEVLVHLYEEKGIDFLKDIDGMFAIALWDDRRQRLVLARDRYGEKPLYYTTHGGVFRFASEIKALLEDPCIPRHLDFEALNQYLTFGFVQPPRTMFHDIHKVAPGEALVLKKSGAPESFTYHEPLLSPAEMEHLRGQDFEWHVKQTRVLFEAAVASCMRADVPVGAFLSGGVDSSAVVACMSRLTGRKVESLTVAYPDEPNCDESGYASKVAERVGANLHVMNVTERDALNAFSDCIYHLDEPVSDPACLNTFLASREFRRRGVLVALVGEGADELFLGYPYYLNHSRIAGLWSALQAVPLVARSVIFSAASPCLGPLGLAVHRDLLRRAMYGESMFLSSEPFYPDCDKARIVGPRLQNLVHSQPSSRLTDGVLACYRQRLSGDALSQMSLAETRMRMAEKLLMRVDKLSMAHSIEVRAPFLNRHLAQYAASLSGRVRAANGQPKSLFKAAVADLLPDAVLKRPKMGFSTPISNWFRGSFGQLLMDRMSSSELFRTGVLDRAGVASVLAHHRRGASHHTKLWNILCLLEWYEQYRVTDIATQLESEPIAQFCT